MSQANSNFNYPITLAITGASGLPYAMRLLECLIQAKHEVYVVVSQAAYWVVAMESDLQLSKQPQKLAEQLTELYQAESGQITVYSNSDWLAPVASGSAVPRSMVVCPCTSGCLAAIANGMSDNVIERAADVMVKENKQLILVHRETPVSAIQLENMLKLARLGVCILPANPGFYNKPKSVNDLVDFIVARILDQLGIENTLMPRWGLEGEEKGNE